MKKILLLVAVLILCSTYPIAQGGVDLRFIPVDSLDSFYEGKTVKIDFFGSKKVSSDSIQTRGFWVSYTDIKLNNKKIDIIAYNGRGVDYWYYDKAYIELHNYKDHLIYRVTMCTIEEIDHDAIKFRWALNTYDKKEGKLGDKSEIEYVWIPKASIDNILIRE